ncbi:MAG: MFS transporter [Trueperaceae bacterium]|nr:MAG: MFS transporter [Trueperaceae bacterium]
MLPRPLVLRLLGIGAGSLALAAIWGLYNVFMPLLLGAFIDSRALRGAIMGLDNVVAIMLIPVIGAWSDRVDGRWGRRLPFLLVGVPITALAFAALPWAAAALWTLLLVDVVFLLAITVYRAPLVALMPDHVTESARPTANGVITLMAAIGGAVALLVIAPTFDRAVWLPFALAAGVALATLIVLVVAAQRHPPHVSTGAIQDDAPLLGALVRDLRSLMQRSQRGALWLLAGLFACFFGFAAVEAQFSVLATETLGVSGGAAGRMLGFASGAFVLAALPAGAVARRLGSLRTMCFGAAVLAVALVVAFVRFDPTVLAVSMAIAGAGWAAVLVPAYPLVVGLGGRDRIGFYTGMYYLFGSGAAIVAPALVGGAMDVFGNPALLLASAFALTLGIALLLASGRHGVERAER